MSERFNQRAQEWDSSDTRQVLAQCVYETIREHVVLHSAMDIIDLGAGTGLLGLRVLKDVHSLTAVDTSSGMLEALMKKVAPADNVTAILKDLSQECIDGQYDGVISSMTLHHIEDLQSLFCNLHVNLKKGGFLALADLEVEDGTFHSEGNDGVHHFGFDSVALKQIIENVGFKNVKFHHAHAIEKEHRSFNIFLVTAFK